MVVVTDCETLTIKDNLIFRFFFKQRRAADKLHNQCAKCGLTLPSR